MTTPSDPKPGAGPLGSGPPGPKPGSGPLGAGPLGPKPGSGPLASGPLGARPGAPSSLRLPGMRPASGPLGPATAPGPTDPSPAHPGAPQTGALTPPEPALADPGAPTPAAPEAQAARPPADGPEDPAAASRRRMAFIVAYMKDPTSDPAFADRPLVYKIVSEERDYQQAQVGALRAAIAQLPVVVSAGDALTEAQAAVADQRSALEARLKTAETRQTQLFIQLKKLTGVKGKTGGTGFLRTTDVPPELPPPRRGSGTLAEG